MSTDIRTHLQTRLALETAEASAREMDMSLHNVAVQFVRGDKTRADLRKALDAADKAAATAVRCNREYMASWRKVVDETIPVE